MTRHRLRHLSQNGAKKGSTENVLSTTINGLSTAENVLSMENNVLSTGCLWFVYGSSRSQATSSANSDLRLELR